MIKLTLEAAHRNVGLTQKEAAKRLGISNKTLGSWENGTTYPNVAMIGKLCDLYGITYDIIFFK